MTKKQFKTKILSYICAFSSLAVFSTPKEVEALFSGNIHFLAQSLLAQSEPDELLTDAILNMYDGNRNQLQQLVDQLDFSAPHINLLTHINRCLPNPTHRQLPHPQVIEQCIEKAILTPDNRENLRKLNYYASCLTRLSLTCKPLKTLILDKSEDQLFTLIRDTNESVVNIITSLRPDILTKNINKFFDELLYGEYKISYSTLLRFYFEKTPLLEINGELRGKIINLNKSQIERLTLLLDYNTMQTITQLRSNITSHQQFVSNIENNNQIVHSIGSTEQQLVASVHTITAKQEQVNGDEDDFSESEELNNL